MGYFVTIFLPKYYSYLPPLSSGGAFFCKRSVAHFRALLFSVSYHLQIDFSSPSAASKPSSYTWAVYAEAGINGQFRELDIAEVRDPFTLTELLIYEDLGFCPEGKAKEYIESGAFELDEDKGATFRFFSILPNRKFLNL